MRCKRSSVKYRDCWVDAYCDCNSTNALSRQSWHITKYRDRLTRWRAFRAARVTETARKTLGTLIGDLLGSYVVVNGDQTAPKDTINSSEDTASFSFRMQLGLSDIDFARTEAELRELVLLRNSLVHHFIEEHGLLELGGCRGAHEALLAAYSRIDQHFEQLRGWAEHMEQSRRLADAFVRSNEFRDLSHQWQCPGRQGGWVCRRHRTRSLREAAKELAVDGWASITEAVSGLPSGSQNSYLRNMAAVGARSCMNRALSRFVT